MHSKITFILILSALFILPSCKKDCTSGCPWGCSGTYTFTGITARDVNGVFTGVSFDSTDWRIDETWCDKELGFFNQTNLNQYNNSGLTMAYRDSLLCQYQNNCNDTVKIVYGAAGYPNLYHNSLDIEIPAAGAAMMQMVIINGQEQNVLNKVVSHDSIVGNTFSYDLAGLVDSGQVVRIYYMFQYPNSNYYFKGHGDLQAQ